MNRGRIGSAAVGTSVSRSASQLQIGLGKGSSALNSRNDDPFANPLSNPLTNPSSALEHPSLGTPPEGKSWVLQQETLKPRALPSNWIDQIKDSIFQGLETPTSLEYQPLLASYCSHATYARLRCWLPVIDPMDPEDVAMLDVFDTRPSLSGGPLEENGEGAVDQLELDPHPTPPRLAMSFPHPTPRTLHTQAKILTGVGKLAGVAVLPTPLRHARQVGFVGGSSIPLSRIEEGRGEEDCDADTGGDDHFTGGGGHQVEQENDIPVETVHCHDDGFDTNNISPHSSTHDDDDLADDSPTTHDRARGGGGGVRSSLRSHLLSKDVHTNHRANTKHASKDDGMTRPAAKRPRTVSHDTTETTEESGELDDEDEINSVTEEIVDEESIDGDKPFRMVSDPTNRDKMVYEQLSLKCNHCRPNTALSGRCLTTHPEIGLSPCLTCSRGKKRNCSFIIQGEEDHLKALDYLRRAPKELLKIITKRLKDEAFFAQILKAEKWEDTSSRELVNLIGTKLQDRCADYIQVLEDVVLPLAKHGENMHRLTRPKQAIDTPWLDDVRNLVDATIAQYTHLTTDSTSVEEKTFENGSVASPQHRRQRSLSSVAVGNRATSTAAKGKQDPPRKRSRKNK